MDLVEIARFLDPTEAQAAAAALRSSGMHVHVQNEHYGQVEPYLQVALGGFGLYASSEDAADARMFIASIQREAAATALKPAPDTLVDEVVTTGVILLAAVSGVLGWLVAPFLQRRRRLED